MKVYTVLSLCILYFIADGGFVVDGLFGFLQLASDHRLGFVGLVQLVGSFVCAVGEVDMLLLQSVLLRNNVGELTLQVSDLDTRLR